MVRQFKHSLGARGKVEAQERQESIRQKELEYKSKHYLVSLAKHIRVGSIEFDSEQLRINNVQKYLKEALETTCKKENEVRIEIESKLTEYSRYLKWCLKQANEEREEETPTLGFSLTEIKIPKNLPDIKL
jgi:hypothetical protein